MTNILPVNSFKEVTIRSVSPSVTSVAVSGQRQTKSFGSQFWQIQAEYASLTREQFNTVMGFLNKQRGSLFQFQVIIPQISDSGGSFSRAAEVFPDRALVPLTVSTARFIGQNLITLNTPSTGITRTQIISTGGDVNKYLITGDFIRFDNHSKVYQIIEDVAASSTSRTSAFSIYPNLYTNVPSGTPTYIYRVPFEVFNQNDSQEYMYSTGDNNSISLDLHEAL